MCVMLSTTPALTYEVTALNLRFEPVMEVNAKVYNPGDRITFSSLQATGLISCCWQLSLVVWRW